MTVGDPNRARLTSVATALGDAGSELVFLGGSVVGLLLTDLAAPRIRETKDVDCVVHAVTRADYDTRVRGMLRARGFVEMNEPAVPLCAWTRSGIRLDVMPLEESVLGFSNRWYRYAWHHPLEVALGDVSIQVVSAPVFIATKLEAFNNRGDRDFRASHDLEDIVAVVDGRREVVEEIQQAPPEVRTFVRSELERMLGDQDFLDALPGHVVDPGREPIVLRRLRSLLLS